MAGSNFKKDMNQNDVVDSAKAFFTSFGILFLVFVVALVASILFPPNHGEQAKDGAAAPSAPVEVNAEQTFKATCAACHGQNLEGVAAPKLADIGSRLSAEEIEGIITNGKGGMPPGLLKGDEMKAVAKWLSEKK
ncbi:YqzM family protein [Brevibacillus sp. SYSU BS000544]|uniref:cytochrome c n=1 Tax=Brevibacillus sp. SYSU BS000544 TaxID=3416443 RepID=UPI003CE580F3